MTLRAVEYLAEADVVVIDQLSREDFVARHGRPDVVVIDAHDEHGHVGLRAAHPDLAAQGQTGAVTAGPDGRVGERWSRPPRQPVPSTATGWWSG